MRAIELLTSVGTGNVLAHKLANKRSQHKSKSNPRLESGSDAASEPRGSTAFGISKPRTFDLEGKTLPSTSSTASTPTRRPLPPLLVKKASVTTNKASTPARRPLPPMLVKKDSVKNLVSDLEDREMERNVLKELDAALVICRQKLSTIESGKEARK
jgi:hypothetical protein